MNHSDNRGKKIVNNKASAWTEFYRPHNLGQVVGNEDAIAALRDWFDPWSPNAKRKAAILHGPAGTGKTSSVYALAEERGYEVVEMNASDTRNKDTVLRIAGSSAKEGSLFSGVRVKRILLIDEVDGITGRKDRGAVKSLLEVIKFAAVPIICTANNAYDPKLTPLRKKSKVIAYRPIHPEDIKKVLKRICKDQQIELTSEELLFIAENAAGDLRSAINDLQGIAFRLQKGKSVDLELIRPSRDKTKYIQESLSDLFHSQNFLEAKRSVDGLDVTYDTLLLWVFENAYLHASDKKLAEVYETIASADRFLGRIVRRQSWRLLSYFFDLITGGVATDVDKPSINIQNYVFPQKIRLYAQTKFSRALINSVASNIAEKVHESRGSAQNEFLPVVKMVLNGPIEPAAKMAYWLELDDNQLKALVEKRDSFKKIKKVMKAIDEYRKKSQTSITELKFSSFDRQGDDWSETLAEWEEKKAKKIEEEKRRKEEKKKRKAAERRARKTTKKGGKGEKKEEGEEEDKTQPSLEQFFN